MIFTTGIAVSVVSLANCIGKLVMGQVNDKLSMKKMLIIWYGLCLPASLYFIFYRGNNVVVALVGVFLIGITGGIYSVPVPLVSGKLFMNKSSYTQAVSYCVAASSLSSAFAGTIFHGFYDVMGSYVSAMLFVLLLTIIGFIIVIKMVLRNKKVFGCG